MQNRPNNWRVGLPMALTTAVLWGMLPIALKYTLTGMDAWTISWWRFAVSMLGLGVFLAWRGELPKPWSASRNALVLLAVALVFLVGNYVLYLVALDHTTPSVAQVVIQLAPILLVMGGVFVFREHFSVWQWAGFAVLVAGLLLFFNHRLPQLLDPTVGLGLGVALIVGAAISWALYGLAQKRLLQHFTPPQVFLMLYLGASVLLLPVSAPADVFALDGLQLALLAFCCANTLIAYGAFGEALHHWDVSRVSAVLSTAPLFTILSMWVLEKTGIALVAPEGLNTLSIAGALAVVAGSMITALAPRNAA